MERLSMSLDDLMAARANGSKNNKSNKGGGAVRGRAKQQAIRSTPYEERPRRKPDPVVRVNIPTPQSHAAPKQQHMSVFARLGKPPVSGTRVSFANLKPSVEENDVQDLCAAIGEIKDVELTVGRNGRNSAVVLFARRSDALSCVEKLNGMTLDGAPMEVSITGEPVESVAPKSVFDRLQGAPVTQNIRHGLFGTAIDSNEEDGDGGPRFSVTLGGTQPAGRQTKLVQPFSGESSTTGSSRGLVQPFAKKAESHRSNNHTSGDGNSNRFLYRDDDNRNGRAGSNERRERGGDRRDQQQQSRGGNNRNNSGHGGAGARGLRGGEDKSNSMDASGLDADLDAYFASKA